MSMIHPYTLILLSDSSEKKVSELTRQTLTSLSIDFLEIVLSKEVGLKADARKQVRRAQEDGFKVIIVCATLEPYLPGIVAQATWLPVIAIPLEEAPGEPNEKVLRGVIQKSAQCPNVATVAIGAKAGGTNAALFAARILGTSDSVVANAVLQHMRQQAKSVAEYPVDEPPKT